MKTPTLEEVDAYIQVHHPEVNAIAFWNFYQAKDWMLGKNKIKNWHCCVATWAEREKEKRGKHGSKRDEAFAEALRRSREDDREDEGLSELPARPGNGIRKGIRKDDRGIRCRADQPGLNFFD